MVTTVKSTLSDGYCSKFSSSLKFGHFKSRNSRNSSHKLCCACSCAIFEGFEVKETKNFQSN